jgi:hypothetical protein
MCICVSKKVCEYNKRALFLPFGTNQTGMVSKAKVLATFSYLINMKEKKQKLEPKRGHIASFFFV